VVKLVVMGNRGDLTTVHCERIEALLPRANTKCGRLASDHRRLLNGILSVQRTGAPWRDLPERYSKWITNCSRFQRWHKSGVWDRVFAKLPTALDGEGTVDAEIHFIDSTILRAHQHAAGEKKYSGTSGFRPESAWIGHQNPRPW